MKSELEGAFYSIKKQTITLYNASIENKIDSFVLSKAKKMIDSNKYVAAFLALSPNSSTTLPNIPFIYFIPISIILIVGFLLKKQVDKKEAINLKQKENIENNWKE
jgi:hypothetical protein